MNLIPKRDRFLEENPFFSIEISDVMGKPLTTFEGCYILKFIPKNVNLHPLQLCSQEINRQFYVLNF